MMSDCHDYPLEEICEAVLEHIKRGATAYQKFSCEKCGERLTIEEPNKFYTEGHCDKCDHVTDLTKHGCNYLLATSTT